MSEGADAELLPEVFIIESLNFGDEQSHRYEGLILTDMLRLAGKSPRYYYFQSIDELEPLARLFESSQYRYLHISAHGTEEEIAVGDVPIPYDEFLSPFRNALTHKRLFFSSCLLGNNNFIEAVERANDSVMSVAAPCDSIYFDVGAAFWSAFYVSSFEDAYGGLSNDLVADKIQRLCEVFELDFFLASRDVTQKRLVTDILIGASAEITFTRQFGAWSKLLAAVE